MSNINGKINILEGAMAVSDSHGTSSRQPTDDLYNSKELMLILGCDAENAQRFSNMVTELKESYIAKNHPYAITKIASGSKAGKYKTYIGKPRKEVVRNTKKQLINYLSKYYTDLEAKKHTFGSLLESMLSDIINEDNRAPKTAATYKYDLMSLLPPEFFNKPINSITESDLKAIIAAQTKQISIKPTRLRKCIQELNRVFSYGIRNHICLSNPAQNIVPNRYLSNCDTTIKTAEEKEFSVDEIESIRSLMMASPSNPRALIALLAIETGMRRAELCALHWEDIEENFIHIHRQQLSDSPNSKNHYEVQYTKDEREHPHGGRRFPITPAIREILTLARKLKGTSEYVFHDGNSWILVDGYTHFLSRKCRSLGITTTNNHAFRVSLNNKFIQLGLSADERSLLLGHSVEVNERHYSKIDNRRLNIISGKLI